MEKQEKGGKSGFSVGEKESADTELRRTTEQRAARLSRWRERDRARRQQLIANETPEERESRLERRRRAEETAEHRAARLSRQRERDRASRASIIPRGIIRMCIANVLCKLRLAPNMPCMTLVDIDASYSLLPPFFFPYVSPP